MQEPQEGAGRGRVREGTGGPGCGAAGTAPTHAHARAAVRRGVSRKGRGAGWTDVRLTPATPLAGHLTLDVNRPPQATSVKQML